MYWIIKCERVDELLVITYKCTSYVKNIGCKKWYKNANISLNLSPLKMNGTRSNERENHYIIIYNK